MIILKYSLKLQDAQNICDFALDGLQAYELVVKNVKENDYKFTQYDMILMDCNMPVLDGYDSADKIRSFLMSLNLAQPVIFAVTGHTEQNYVKKAINSGMNQVLSKPLNSDILKKLMLKINFGSKLDPPKKRSNDLSKVKPILSKLSQRLDP